MAWAIAAAVIAVIAALASAYASYQQGQTAQKASRYNAKIAEQRAQYERQVADYKARQQKKHDDLVISSMLAKQAASGVATEEGSPLILDTDAAKEEALNQKNIISGGEANAQGLLAQAELDRWQGDSAYRAGITGAGVSLLNGASSAAGGYAKYRASTRVAGGYSDMGPE